MFKILDRKKYNMDIKEATKICKQIANGNFEARLLNINENDELAPLFNEINNIIDRSDAYIRETSAAMQHVAEKKYFRKILLDGLPDAYGHGAKIINSSIDKIKLIDDQSLNLAKILDEMISTANNKTSEINALANESINKTDITANKSFDVANSASRSAENINSVAVATEQMVASSNEIANQISKTAEAANETFDQTEKTAARLSSLSNAAQSISSVVDMITDIASQTNLLALNATIEAARAGEMGKGFSVVASEVKSLANQTSKATENIIEQVANIQDVANIAVDEINNVKKICSHLTESSQSIAAAVEEQNAAQSEISEQIRLLSDEINNVSENITGVVQTSANSYASSIQVIWSSNDLEHPIAALNEQMSKFMKIIGTENKNK